jgi:hypothetical protein
MAGVSFDGVTWRGTSMPSAAYSEILFRKVRIDTPSKRADSVRLPSVLASVSRTRSRSTSRRGEPTNHRAKRRREAREIGACGAIRAIELLHFTTPAMPVSKRQQQG